MKRTIAHLLPALLLVALSVPVSLAALEDGVWGGAGYESSQAGIVIDPTKTKECLQGDIVSASESLRSVPGADVYFKQQKEIEDYNKANPTATPKQNTSIIIKKNCGGDDFYQTVSSAAALETVPLPSLFTPPAKDKTATCTMSFDGTKGGIKCEGNLGSGLTLRLPTCELFQQGISSSGIPKEDKERLSTFACTELLDPLPATYFDADTICVVKNPDGKNWAFKTSTEFEGEYCNAILTKTGGGFSGFFAIVRLLYDISLPILIALAVISLIGVGVFIMYAPGGAEDSMKQAKTMAIRIFSGLMLLLFLRVFLSLISVDLFGAEEKTPPSQTPVTTEEGKSIKDVTN